jgi:hypothetical protein
MRLMRLFSLLTGALRGGATGRLGWAHLYLTSTLMLSVGRLWVRIFHPIPESSQRLGHCM